MDSLVFAIEDALTKDNPIAAVILAILIPDICGKLEFKKNGYGRWFAEYMPEDYTKYVSANDSYAIRCALLHSYSNDLTQQKKIHDKVDKYVFIIGGSHLGIVSSSDEVTHLILNPKKYAEDLLRAYRSWGHKVALNSKLKAKFEELEANSAEFSKGKEIVPGIYIE